MPENLGPRERIRKQKDFFVLYKKGKRYRGKYFTLIHFPNNLEFCRFAVVASKKVGNAVRRNKIKRRMRTLFRRNKNSIIIPMDLIVIASAELHNLSWTDLQNEFLKALNSVAQYSKYQ